MIPRIGIAAAAWMIALGAQVRAAPLDEPRAVRREDRRAAGLAELLLADARPSFSGRASFRAPRAERGSASAAASTIFSLPGTFLTSSASNHNWQYDMRFPATLEFRNVKIDFDVYVAGWDPENASGWHCLFWLNKGKSYANMMGYLNALGTRDRTKFEVNYLGEIRDPASGGVEPGGTYHVHYEFDLVGQTTWYSISQDGTPILTRSFPRSGSSFSTSYHFIQFGTQIAPEGPEAKTYGWQFSNFRGEFVP